METVVAAFLILIVIFAAVLTLSQASLAAQDTVQESWRDMETRYDDQSHTDLAVIGVVTDEEAGEGMTVTLRNEGDTRLTDFDQWDVFLEYYGPSGTYKIRWLAYSEEIDPTNAWTVSGIYADAAAGIGERFEPGILNPGEEMVVRIGLSPAIGLDTANRIAISATNGVGTSTIFLRTPTPTPTPSPTPTEIPTETETPPA
jgi:archaellum component FlaF (FlaF/FlaG flagellin family)